MSPHDKHRDDDLGEALARNAAIARRRVDLARANLQYAELELEEAAHALTKHRERYHLPR